VNYREPPVPAFLFDLDGTLIDSVYQNVIAWRNALATVDVDLSVWRIHRRIGMSGGLFISALLRETGRTLTDAEPARSSVPPSVSYSITTPVALNGRHMVAATLLLEPTADLAAAP
jgi:phosphoglycolate phosphatase-like HAD superfamily hydrolase